MKHQLHRKEIQKGITFNWVQDPKFKRNRISIHSMLPLKLESVSHNTMIPLLLRKGSASLGEDENIYTQLNHLYGAVLTGGSGRYNSLQRVFFTVQSLDNAYAMEGEDLITSSVELLLDCFFHPNFQRDFRVEKQYLIDQIQGEINDKRSYAINQTLLHMFESEGICLPQFGTVETAETVTPASVEHAWKQMLQTAPMEIIFTGSGDPQRALDACTAAFRHLDRTPQQTDLIVVKETPEKVSYLREELPGLQQGKLVMGFRSKTLNTYQDKIAARVFSALFGSTPFSKLFLNVRERLSLCYYCSSQFETVSGYLLVDSGVDEANNEKTQEEVLRQLEAVQQGDFTQEELDHTKLLLANALQSTGDSLGNVEGWYLSQILLGETHTPEDEIALVNQVTREDVIAIANGVALDTVYFLTGKEDVE